jgi:hypothetical protein
MIDTAQPGPKPYELPKFSRNEANDKLREIMAMAPTGQYDGAHHKMWVIDQIVRIITGDDYEAWVTWFRGEEDEYGDFEYSWDEGIAP